MWQEVEHQVGVVHLVVGADEAAALEVVGGAGTPPEEQPLEPDPGASPPGQLRLQATPAASRRTGCRPRGGPAGSCPTPGRWWTGEITDRAQVVGVADPRELEELRRVDRPAAEDHLTRLDATEPAVVDVVDTGGTGAGEGHPRTNAPVVTDRLGRCITGCRYACDAREPPAPVHVAVEGGEALLLVAVDVVGERVTGLLGRPEERPEERVGGRAALEHQRAARRATRPRRPCRSPSA
jgi:hypothetical protein